MAITIPAKNELLNLLNITHISLHTAQPNDNGSNELTHVNYLRTPVAFNQANEANKIASTPINIEVPSNTYVHSIGFWDNSLGGNFKGYDLVNETFNSSGILSINPLIISLNTA